VSVRTHRTAVLLIAANVGVVTVLWVSQRSRFPDHPAPVELGAFCGVFALVGALRMRLDFSEHRAAFSFADAVFATGLFYLAPPWLALAAGIGEAIRCTAARASLVKVVFNATNHAATAIVAGAAFVVLGGGSNPSPRSWLPALAAVACWGFMNAASVSGAIALAERRSFQRTLSNSVPTAVATTVVGAPVGVLVAHLLHEGAVYPVLMLPVAFGVWLNSRYASAQRDEHLRVERLYEATAQTAHLAPDLDVIAVVADEARRLLTGTAAICWIRDGTGKWSGRSVRGGTGGVVADVEGRISEIDLPESGALTRPVPTRFRELAGSADWMVVARSPKGDLILAVFRKGADAGSGVGQTLAAFSAHGAVIAANEELLTKLQRSLQAEKEANRRKDEFVATISHELRTPLTVMLGAAQTVLRLRDRLAPEDHERLLCGAVEQGKRLQMLIENLLLVAAAEQGRVSCDVTSFTAAELTLDVQSDLPEWLRRRVNIANRASATSMVSDRYKLRQLVANLTENAGKYAPESRIEVEIAPFLDAVRVAVVDHGPGIPPADRKRVFERFTQLDQSSTRPQGGTGLGLFICRKLAEQLKATLELSDTPGGGCTFELFVPPLEETHRKADVALRQRPPSVRLPAVSVNGA
jgi:signal transduction histidine kinase